jgi:hypothetical protein
MNVAVVRKNQIARPLKVLVPLIQGELATANAAGLEHYRRAGEMLVEAKEQVTYGSWGRWLSKNFELSQVQARRYMRLARAPEPYSDSSSIAHDRSLAGAIGEKPSQFRAKYKELFEEAEKVDVPRLAEERQMTEDEVKRRREMAQTLIDLGYRAMATRLHPDRGGSRDAMVRLNEVRDQLKSVAATRRFV